MTFRPTLLLLSCVCLVAGESAPSQARIQAQTAIEAERDVRHREIRRLVWAEDRQDPPPAQLDLLLVRGYMDRELLHATWRDGSLSVRLARQERANFHNPNAAGLRLERVSVAPAVFATAWASVMQLQALGDAPTVEEPEPADTGYFGSSTSAAYHLITWRDAPAGVWSDLPVLRHRRSRGGAGVIAELRVAAIDRVLWDLVPQAARQPADETADRPAWLELGRAVLPGCHGDAQGVLSERARLLAQDFARLFGDLGDDTDAGLLAALTGSLRPSIEPAPHQSTSPTYWEDSVRAEVAKAQSRITTRMHLDPEAVRAEIHANDHGTYPGNQHERWLRQALHERAPEFYLAMLLADLQAADPILVGESVAELDRLHRGRQPEALRPLLAHADPEVVLAAALAILGVPNASYGWHVDPGLARAVGAAADDPRSLEALRAIQHLAGDPTVPLPPGRNWFNSNARTQAIGVLMACPPPWQWDEERSRRQLADPAEREGRVVLRLLQKLGIEMRSGAVPPRETLTDERRAFAVAVWRRCLGDPPTRGTLLAMQELAKLGDEESRPRMREVLATLRAGCNAGLSHIPDPTARYPWTDRYDLERIEGELGLAVSPPP
jgi:hypothetical protein